MSERESVLKEKTDDELFKEEKDFEKKCVLVKKQLDRMERENKEPIPRRILKMKFTI